MGADHATRDTRDAEAQPSRPRVVNLSSNRGGVDGPYHGQSRRKLSAALNQNLVARVGCWKGKNMHRKAWLMCCTLDETGIGDQRTK
jgi:hypothetical protein